MSPYDVISLNIFERLFWTNISFLSLIVEKEISYVDSKFEIGETGNHLMNLLYSTHIFRSTFASIIHENTNYETFYAGKYLNEYRGTAVPKGLE